MSKWFEFNEEQVNIERAKEFDRIFADLYEKLDIEPILKENGKKNKNNQRLN